jgi:hypothetical protein
VTRTAARPPTSTAARSRYPARMSTGNLARAVRTCRRGGTRHRADDAAGTAASVARARPPASRSPPRWSGNLEMHQDAGGRFSLGTGPNGPSNGINRARCNRVGSRAPSRPAADRSCPAVRPRTVERSQSLSRVSVRPASVRFTRVARGGGVTVRIGAGLGRRPVLPSPCCRPPLRSTSTALPVRAARAVRATPRARRALVAAPGLAHGGVGGAVSVTRDLKGHLMNRFDGPKPEQVSPDGSARDDRIYLYCVTSTVRLAAAPVPGRRPQATWSVRSLRARPCSPSCASCSGQEEPAQWKVRGCRLPSPTAAGPRPGARTWRGRQRRTRRAR